MSLLGLSEHGGLLRRITPPRNTGTSCWAGGSLAALAILTLVSFFINFVRQLNRLLGPGTLVSLLLGRYHRPVAEDRIFMFLDLNDSDRDRRPLGPCASTTSRTTSSTTSPEPVLATRGRIYQYVGDEAVVTWTTERGLRQGNCLRCVFLVSERIDEQKDRYLARYGRRPRVQGRAPRRARGHRGDRRHQKDIVHSGDTVNTAARVEAQCRPLERRVLVSEALLRQCQVPEELEVEDMGERGCAGRLEALRLFSVRSVPRQPSRSR